MRGLGPVTSLILAVILVSSLVGYFVFVLKDYAKNKDIENPYLDKFEKITKYLEVPEDVKYYEINNQTVVIKNETFKQLLEMSETQSFFSLNIFYIFDFFKNIVVGGLTIIPNLISFLFESLSDIPFVRSFVYIITGFLISFLIYKAFLGKILGKI